MHPPMTAGSEWTEALREQYEAFPYPQRDPADEKRRLIQGSPGHMLEVDHYLFQGKRDWSRPFDVLVAGGGTGDALIMIAQHLADRGCPARILYVDLSSASLEIARRRAEERGFLNIEFRQASLFDVRRKDGPFNYIDCCGVLHHLPHPPDGLRHLASLLQEDGGMGLMVYATLGRIGVYHMQTMLRMLNYGQDLSPADQVGVARNLCKTLPQTSWFRRNPFIVDHTDQTDAGLYDLLLHSQDRPYLVPEFLAFVEDAGLSIASLMEPALYKPSTYTDDPQILARTDAMDWHEQATFAEYLAGNIIKHTAYVTFPGRAKSCVASLDDRDAVPVFPEPAVGSTLQKIQPGKTARANRGGTMFTLTVDKPGATLLTLIDGKRSVGEILTTAREKHPDQSEEALEANFRKIMTRLTDFNLALLSSRQEK